MNLLDVSPFALYFTEITLADGDTVEVAVWSALVEDPNTCSMCVGLDGMMVPVDSDTYRSMQPPIHDRGRCMWMISRKSLTGFSEVDILGVVLSAIAANNADKSKPKPQYVDPIMIAGTLRALRGMSYYERTNSIWDKNTVEGKRVRLNWLLIFAGIAWWYEKNKRVPPKTAIVDGEEVSPRDILLATRFSALDENEKSWIAREWVNGHYSDK